MVARSSFRPTELTLKGPGYTDAAVEQITSLKGLESITLFDTRLTDAGIARIRAKLPECDVVRL